MLFVIRRQTIKTTITNLLSQIPDRLLTDQEEKKLTRRAADGDKRARGKLVLYNSRLVISIAQRYKDNGVPLEDLVMAGFEGLVKGVDRFNPELGYKLSTYTTWWIKQKVLRELDDNSTTIRFPGYLRNLRRQVHKLERERGDELTISEIRDQFEVSEQVAHQAKTTTTTRSLDAELSNFDHGNLKQIVENEKAEIPSRSTQELKAEKLEETMNERFSDRERRVVKLYYGLEDYKQRTLQEVGEVFGVSRERIRQLRDRGLEKLKKASKLRDVRNLD